MSYRVNYVPRRRRLNYKVLIPLLVLLLLVVYTGVTLLFKKNEQPTDVVAICGLKPYDTRRLIEQRVEYYKEIEPYIFKDYGVYGESFSVYHEPYNATQPDDIVGKMFFLTNICNENLDEKLTFLMGKELDMRLNFAGLEDGFYEIEVVTDLKTQRLISEEPVDVVFHSVARDGKVKRMRLLSNQTYFDYEDDIVMDKHYAFLEISSVDVLDDNEVDVVLDPSGGTFFDNGSINYGASYRELSEYTEMYKAAQGIKSILEENGLRVLITRDNQTGINIYGKEGRLDKAYTHKAKYYVQLRFETSGSTNDKGLIVYYSNFATNRFASNVAKRLIANTEMQTTIYEDGKNIKGVYQTMLRNGLDYSDIIRETGAKFTSAGTVEGFINSVDFAKESRNGMNTISILYGYMTDGHDYETWQNQSDVIISETAAGILTQLGITPKGE